MNLQIRNSIIDLRAITGVTHCHLNYMEGVKIHIECMEDTIDSVLDLLPTIVHLEMTVTKQDNIIILS